MTNNFFIWFWNRRSDTQKVLMVVIPVDAFFITSLFLFTGLPGAVVLAMTALLTGAILGIFKIVEFFINEYKSFQKAQEEEGDMIVRRLRGVELKTTRDEELIDQLRAYHKAKVGR